MEPLLVLRVKSTLVVQFSFLRFTNRLKKNHDNPEKLQCRPKGLSIV
jgi:hypothetical protein